jgi:DNA polymerase III delta' subunit
MKPFHSLTAQKQAHGILQKAVESGRLAHAYILAGPQGSGRLTSAMHMAKIQMCGAVPGEFCGECSQCRQIDAFSHPDVRLTIPMLKGTDEKDILAILSARAADGVTPVRVEGNTYISIEQVRTLQRRLSMRSFEGSGYVEIILDAHLMRKEAANALLKTLEEPPARTLIILITESPSALLPTVRSRAHMVRFGRLSAATVSNILISRTGIPAFEAARIAVRSDGCPGKALLLQRDGVRGDAEARRLFEVIAGGEEPVHSVIGLSDQLAREHGREGLLQICSDLLEVIHDAKRSHAGAYPLTGEAPSLTGFEDVKDLDRLTESLLTCRDRIKANVSPAMALGAFLASAVSRGGV